MVGEQQLLAVATAAVPRHSEGDLIALRDGRLLAVWGCKQVSSSDKARGMLLAATSADDGLTWTSPREVLQPWGDKSDVMSVSLLRTSRGLHCIFCARGPIWHTDTRPHQMISPDDGLTWSAPECIAQRQGYHVHNNARVVQLSSGRLLLPIAFHGDFATDSRTPNPLLCLLSDGLGLTWRESPELRLDGQLLYEPGVAECADGSLYMTIRTELGCLAAARSVDGGETWTTPTPTDLGSSPAPSTVVRDPAGDQLWMLWEDCATTEFGWHVRKPLTLATSHDHGATWGNRRVIDESEVAEQGFGYVAARPVGEWLHLLYSDVNRPGTPVPHPWELRWRRLPLGWVRAWAG